MSGDTWPCGDPTCEREDCQPNARPAAGDTRTDRERLREAVAAERRAADLHAYFTDSETDARYEAARAVTDAAVAALDPT